MAGKPDGVVENDGGVGAAGVLVMGRGGRGVHVGAGSCGLTGKSVVFWVAFQAQANVATEGGPGRKYGRAKPVNVGDGVGALAAEKTGKGVGGEAPVGEGVARCRRWSVASALKTRSRWWLRMCGGILGWMFAPCNIKLKAGE